ncbi:MAG: hypothetical protein ABIA59_08670 [Candidatus Latescibacterota bacterium]
MKRAVWIVAAIFLFVGCQKKHPVKVYANPAMQPDALEKVAVFHFSSMLHQGEDPNGEAPKMLEKFFMPELDKRDDYNFIAPSSVAYAIQSLNLEEKAEKFLKAWPTEKVPDMEILSALAERLACDAFLIPVVELWQKDEADLQENASSATYVGATITLLNASNGTVLFEATDENYAESARTETSDRTVIRGGSGGVKSDFGDKVYKAPPFEGVVQRVVTALVMSIPAR